MSDKERTFADELRAEADLLRRRFVYHTRPKRLLTMEEAGELCRRMESPVDTGNQLLSEQRDLPQEPSEVTIRRQRDEGWER